MVALVEFVLADDSEKTGITFQARGMKCDSIQKMLDPIEAALRIFQRDPSDQPVDFIAEGASVRPDSFRPAR